MIPWQVDSNILKTGNFFARATQSMSITQTTSKWSGPVNLLTLEVSGQWSVVSGQRSEVSGQRSEVRGQRSEVRGQRSEVSGDGSLVR